MVEMFFASWLFSILPITDSFVNQKEKRRTWNLFHFYSIPVYVRYFLGSIKTIEVAFTYFYYLTLDFMENGTHKNCIKISYFLFTTSEHQLRLQHTYSVTITSKICNYTYGLKQFYCLHKPFVHKTVVWNWNFNNPCNLAGKNKIQFN